MHAALMLLALFVERWTVVGRLTSGASHGQTHALDKIRLVTEAAGS